MSGRDVIELSVTVPGTVDEVWQLLVDPNHVRAWFGSHVQLDAKPGGAFREEWSIGTRRVTTTGRIIAFGPPKLLSWTWADDDWPSETRLTLELESGKTTRSTLVKLTHAGWSRLEAETGRSLKDAHEAGWRSHLQSLKHYAEGRA